MPSYSIHRIKKIWGDDCEEYRPERWLQSEEKTRELEKALKYATLRLVLNSEA